MHKGLIVSPPLIVDVILFVNMSNSSSEILVAS